MGEKLMWNKMLSGNKNSGAKSMGSREGKRKSLLMPNTVGPLNNTSGKPSIKTSKTMVPAKKTNQVQP